MSALPQELPRSNQSLKPGQAIIVGRVFEVDRTENAVYTTIQTPAIDSYSNPGFHKVTSSRLLGKPQDEVTVKVHLTGYRRSYTNKHGEKVYTVDNNLKAVDD